MNRKTPEDFCFCFPDGQKWLKDMDKADLLHVIAYLKDETERKGAELRGMLGMSLCGRNANPVTSNPILKG